MGELDQAAWRARVIEKHGSVEAAKQQASEYGKRAAGIPKKGGFYNNPEKARIAQSLSVAAKSKKKG